MMRNTSPVGWIPLLAIKVFKEDSLIPFIKSSIFVALPIILVCILIDTTMYGSSTWVVTSYNFLQMNIVMGLSKTFGEDPWHWYLTFMMPVNITILTPFVFVSVLYTHVQQSLAKLKIPYITFYVVFYVFFFSLIAHKEIRFMLPVWSFILVCIGELWSIAMKTWTRTFSFLLKLVIFVDVISLLVYETQMKMWYRIRHDLAKIEPPIHSVWLWDPLGTPHYSLLHRQGTPVKIYSINQNPSWYRNMKGDPLPINMEHGLTYCTETVDLLTRGVVRPQYLVIGSIGCLGDRGLTCESIC